MRTYDFAPLWRSTIGFDRLFDLAETAQRASEDNYPPYNIERLADDRYQISLRYLMATSTLPKPFLSCARLSGAADYPC